MSGAGAQGEKLRGKGQAQGACKDGSFCPERFSVMLLRDSLAARAKSGMMLQVVIEEKSSLHVFAPRRCMVPIEVSIEQAGEEVPLPSQEGICVQWR
jgi:hypothetical protein